MGLPYPIPVPFSVPYRCQLIAGFIPRFTLSASSAEQTHCFCISERPLGRGDTSIFSLTRCISTGILSYTASLYNTSTPHRNLYVGITELIVTQQSPHGTYCFLFFTDGRETVRALHSDLVVVCQPLRCITLSLVASLVSLCEAWYTRAQLAVSLSLCRRKIGGRFNLIFCYAFNMQNNLKSVTLFREVF